MKRLLTILISCITAIFICLSAIGCDNNTKVKDLTDGYKRNIPDNESEMPEPPNNNDASDDNLMLPKADDSTMTDFSLRLFVESHAEGENTLISPLSVISALGMTAGGARNNTLAQMESVFGANIDSLNEYLCSYISNLPQGEKHKLKLTNSIWLNSSGGFNPDADFLQNNVDYYGAGVFEGPFDDSTVKEINNWVKDGTDGMIEKIINEIPENTIMYLINALAFDAEWSEVYDEYNVRDGVFICEDGSVKDVELMYSGEGVYLEDEYAKGFIKYYKDHKYAFVALLPNEDVTVSEYINQLDGDSLREMLTNPTYTQVRAAIPKFEVEFSTEMSEILIRQGMTDAFSESFADFSGMGTADGNIFISRVLHKTFISVGDKGTRAAAVTAVEVACESAAPIEEPKTVYLDRPFVYMLIDCENNIPFFIGALMDPSK